MPRADHPLTPQQVRILAAGDGRALEIAARAGVKIEVVYPALARLVARGLLEKAGEPPVYTRTGEGGRRLEASRAYQETMRGAV